MRPSASILLIAFCGAVHAQSSVTVSTTSGQLQGIEQDGVMSFKGVVSFTMLSIFEDHG
jgi:hypothetical protein